MNNLAFAASDGPRILIIDDDAAFRGECSEALAHLGIVSRGSDCVPDSRQLAQVSGVIVDLGLPHTSGYDVIDALVKTCPEARILVASGRGNDLLRSAVAYARNIGFADVHHMAKPLSDERLSTWASECVSPVDARKAIAKDTQQLSAADAIRIFRDGGLCACYQGQYRLSDGMIVGVEALARLRLADGTLLAPTAFLSHLLNADLGRELFTMMLEESLDLLTRAARFIGSGFRIALNLSEDLLSVHQEWLLRVLSGPHIPAHRITLELPETASTTATAHWNGVISRLRLLGYGASLDDFGREASNLDRLVTLPITEVKIDRMFVEQVHDGMLQPGVLASMNRISQALGLTTVVEGISSQAALDLCRSLGFDFGQGYHMSRPLTEAALLEHLKANGAARYDWMTAR